LAPAPSSNAPIRMGVDKKRMAVLWRSSECKTDDGDVVALDYSVRFLSLR
jgi:hypothetical protein